MSSLAALSVVCGTIGMAQNASLARHVSDAAFAELRGQLVYKSTWYGTRLVVADRWYPPGKTCSGCGRVNPDLTLADRFYTCTGCGLVLDRDLNAAVNLARYPPRPRHLLHRHLAWPPERIRPRLG